MTDAVSSELRTRSWHGPSTGDSIKLKSTTPCYGEINHDTVYVCKKGSIAFILIEGVDGSHHYADFEIIKVSQ